MIGRFHLWKGLFGEDWPTWGPLVFCVLCSFLTASSQAASEPALLETGVVVEEVVPGSVLAKAGLQPGDVLHSWERLPNPPANPEGTQGELESVFDWLWMELEQAPRGAVRLIGKREDERVVFEVQGGGWEVRPGTIRPIMPPELLVDYLKGKELVEAKDFEQGVAFWQEISKRARDRNNMLLRCWLHLRIGEIWAATESWQKAQAAFRSAMEATREPKIQVAVWNAEGRAYENQGSYAQAEISYRSAIEVWSKEWGEGMGWAHSHFRLGSAKAGRISSENSRNSAAHSIRVAITLQERLAPKSFALARSLNGIGMILRSEKYHQQALEILKKLNLESIATARVLNNLGSTTIFSDRIATRTYLQQALEIIEQQDPAIEWTSDLHSIVLSNLGIIAHQAGDLELAEEYYLRHLNTTILQLGKAHTLNNLGQLAVDRGDTTSAEEFFKRSLNVYKEINPLSRYAKNVISNMAALAVQRGELEKAERHLHDVIKLRQEAGLDTAKNLASLGILAARQGRLALAEAYYRQAQDWFEGTTHQVDKAKYWSSLGELSVLQERPEIAAEYYDLSLEILERSELDNILTANIMNRLALLAKDRKDFNVAGELFHRSIDILEEKIEELGGLQSIRGNFRANHSQLYQDYIKFLLQTNHHEEAFAVHERSRARSFLETLGQRDISFRIPEEVAEARRSLGVGYDRVQQQIAHINPTEFPHQFEEFQKKLTKLQRERTELIDRIRRSLPQFAALQYPQPLKLREAQEILDPGTVMLSYSVGKEQTDLFVLTPDKALEVHTLAVGEDDLLEMVNDFRNQIQKARSETPLGPVSRPAAKYSGRRLYQLLVKSAADVVEANNRVLIIPDGPLHLLPFGALIREDSSASISRKEHYFAEWKPLHTVLSATVYAEIQKSRRTGLRRNGEDPLIAAFGDPHFSLNPKDATNDDNEITDVRVRSATRRCQFVWDRLPGSRREILEVSGLHRNAQTYLGVGATEERVKTLGDDVRIVHFATHGCFDNRFPLNSGLALTFPRGFPEGRDNGLLQAWEIIESVRLDADLVVLSACETGVGKEQKGEGLIGLTRAFQYAGARTVAASLWQVDDRVTAELMVRFYRHLRAGKSKDVALQEAQIELIRGPIEVTVEDGQLQEIDASAPYYWAAFQMIGDWQ